MQADGPVRTFKSVIGGPEPVRGGHHARPTPAHHRPNPPWRSRPRRR